MWQFYLLNKPSDFPFQPLAIDWALISPVSWVDALSELLKDFDAIMSYCHTTTYNTSVKTDLDRSDGYSSLNVVWSEDLDLRVDVILAESPKFFPDVHRCCHTTDENDIL